MENFILGHSGWRDDVITKYGKFKNWLQSLELFLGAWCCFSTGFHTFV